MRKLSATNKLKKAALVVMAKSLNPDEINGLQQLFRNIDADSSGTITIDELRTALTSCNGNMSVSNGVSSFSPLQSDDKGLKDHGSIIIDDLRTAPPAAMATCR